MAEIKISCPNCFNDIQCFESKVETEELSSYMCFACGFASNSLYVNDSDTLKKVQDSSTELMRELSMYDNDRKIHWFPTILNVGKLGMIYPEGKKENWTWKFAEVREFTLDIDNTKECGHHEFLDACKEMGILKELD
jgi:phage pi2 protein 07